MDSLLVWHILWVLKTVWWHISTITAPHRIGSHLKNPLQYFLSFCRTPQNRRPDLPLARSQVWLPSSDGVLQPTCSGKELRTSIHFLPAVITCYERFLVNIPCFPQGPHPPRSRLSLPLPASSFTPVPSPLSFNSWAMFVKHGFHYISPPYSQI